jgi:Ca-activated chloride channel family protein
LNDSYHGQVNDQQKQQIIDTAIEHHLVSQFTSLVAVDKTPSRTAEKLYQQRIKNMHPKGSQTHPKKLIHYPNTGLDLDIQFRQSLMLLALSLFLFFVYRKFL